jgi:precorrin-2 dehydrogenase/sirohydrochlorin ferrochelatase
MDSFPAFFPLAGRRIVIAGAGEAADAKARLFDGSPAVVARLSDAEALTAEAYAGAALAFVAGGDEAFLNGAAAAARAAGTPVNVVDHPALCDFITPAVVDRGEVVAAVGTTGASPMLAAMLRNDVEAAIPQAAGRVAALFRQLRDEIRAALPDLAERRAFLRQALTGPVAEAASGGDMDGAARMLRKALADDRLAAHAGRVCVIDGAGPADLLSLRASRALSLAEALIADPDCAPGVLGLVRREARRLSAGSAGAAEIIALARAGVQVVRLVTAPLDPALLAALAESGIVVETLASAKA